MSDTLQEKTLYIFIDESGDFNFSPKGSKNFYLTAFTTFNPAVNRDSLLNLKYALLATGEDQEYFHATEDRQVVRDRVFDFIASLNDQYEVHTVFAKKNRTNPYLYEEIVRRKKRVYRQNTGFGLYKLLCRTLLHYMFRGKVYKKDINKIVVVVASLFEETSKNRAVIEEVKKFLKLKFPNVQFQIYCHTMKSEINCQLADYCCWAFSVKYERGEIRPYNVIKKQIKSEFDIFRQGSIEYY